MDKKITCMIIVLLFCLFRLPASLADDNKNTNRNEFDASGLDSEVILVEKLNELRRNINELQLKIKEWKIVEDSIKILSQRPIPALSKIQSLLVDAKSYFQDDGTLSDITKFNQSVSSAVYAVEDIIKSGSPQYGRDRESEYEINLFYQIWMQEINNLWIELDDNKHFNFIGQNAYKDMYQKEALIKKQDDFKELAEFLDDSRLKKISNTIQQLKNKKLTEVNQKILNYEEKLKNKKREYLVAKNKLKKEKTEINQIAIIYGLPLFCITIVILFVSQLWFSSKQHTSTDSHTSKSSDFLVELITVLLLTMTILILGLAGKMPGEVLGTLLGGISGYVLNRVRSGSKNDGS